MKTRFLSLSLAVLLLLACLNGCGKKENTAKIPDVGYLPYESYPLDYSVNGQEVQIRCVLSLVNQGSEAVRIRLFADFPEDVGTLLKDERLPAALGSTGEEIITLEPGTVREVGVVFTGEFGGTVVKNSRVVPDLFWEDADNPGHVQALQPFERANRQ